MSHKGDWKYDTSLREWMYYDTKFDRDVYRSGGELRFGEFLVTEEAIFDWVKGGWHLAEKAETVLRNGYGVAITPEWRDLGILVDVDLERGYWYVLRDGEVLLIPGAVDRKPVRVVPDGSKDSSNQLVD